MGEEAIAHEIIKFYIEGTMFMMKTSSQIMMDVIARFLVKRAQWSEERKAEELRKNNPMEALIQKGKTVSVEFFENQEGATKLIDRCNKYNIPLYIQGRGEKEVLVVYDESYTNMVNVFKRQLDIEATQISGEIVDQIQGRNEHNHAQEAEAKTDRDPGKTSDKVEEKNVSKTMKQDRHSEAAEEKSHIEPVKEQTEPLVSEKPKEQSFQEARPEQKKEDVPFEPSLTEVTKESKSLSKSEEERSLKVTSSSQEEKEFSEPLMTSSLAQTKKSRQDPNNKNHSETQDLAEKTRRKKKSNSLRYRMQQLHAETKSMQVAVKTKEIIQER